MTKRPRSLITAPPAESWFEADGLWQCPACGKRYPRRGQGHSCVVVPLDDHFRDRPRARALFESLRAAVEEEGGPVRLSVAKTRIGLITRLTFAAVTPRKRDLRAHLLLLRKVDSPRFVRVDHLPPYWVHSFLIRDESDLDDEMRGWLRESYQIGTAGNPGSKGRG